MGIAPDAVKRLVDLSACNAQADHFDQNRDAYLSGSYREEQPVEDADGRQLTADGLRRRK
jgi:hypothetical protein